MSTNMNAVMKVLWFTPGTFRRWGLPVIVKGPPGGGKTSQIAALAEAFGFGTESNGFESIIGSVREPADTIGIPYFKDGVMHYAPPSWANRVNQLGGGVVLFDELNTSAPAVQAAMLRVVLEGWVGDLKLPHRVRFVAAMNATEDAAGGWDLAAPLANRFGHMDMPGLSAEQWGNWLMSADERPAPIDAKREEERVMSLWPAAWSRARGHIAGFIRARPELLHKMPKSGSPEASGAWASPRTMEMACRAMAGCHIHGLTADDTDVVVSSFVGTAVFAEYMTWERKADLPEPADVLDGKADFKPNKNRLDITAAVLTGCTAFVTSDTSKKKDERVEAMWKIIGGIVEDCGDLAVPAMTALVNAKLHVKNPTAFKMLAKYDKLLAAARI